MLRRDFFKTLPTLTAAAAMLPEPALAAQRAQAGQLQITDVRLIRIRLIRDKGGVPRRVDSIPPDTGPLRIQIGGFTAIELHTNQGLVGIGPGIPPEQVEGLKRTLVGRDPWDVNQPAGAPGRGMAPAVEIALWDLLGKAANQPLYKMWGGVRDRILPYAAMWGVGTPEERAEMALRVKEQGWPAIKLRSSFGTLKDDVRLVELVRQAVGDDFHILTDGNKAPGNADAGGDNPTLWNFTRAYDTAMEYQRLNVYWFEEPLPRFDFERIAELNRLLAMPMAGAEGNNGLHEFKWLLDQGCYDILMPEIIRLGPNMSRTIGNLAAAYNKQVSPHGAPQERRLVNIIAMHMAASTPNCPILEFIHEPPIGDLFEGWQVFENAPALDQEGYLPMPQGPGLGVSFRPDLIEPA
jgi:L-alanine-DL-glutamate epimerase-like enolase superfamily enzyme